jgi:hypothetical protein
MDQYDLQSWGVVCRVLTMRRAIFRRAEEVQIRLP